MATFPEGFVWGTATASYQIEGAVDEDGRGASIWDTFSHTPGKVYRGDTGDIACDHYHRLEEDLEIMADIGIRAYRFSVAWPRIQPDGSAPANQRGSDFCRRLVDGLRERSIEPVLTLYHWDLPQTLEDRGGWTSRETSERFAEYVEIVYGALADSVPFWITLNEPWVSSWMGHAYGVHAPGHTDPAKALSAAHHLLLGHGLALSAMRSAGPAENQIGITLNLHPALPARDREADAEAARRVDGQANRLYLDPVFHGQYPEDLLSHYRGRGVDPLPVRDGDLETISGPLDFLGVNYYFRHHIREAPGEAAGPSEIFADLEARGIVPHDAEKTAMGWPVEPEGLTQILVRIKDEYADLPIYVTENGRAVYDYVDPEGEVKDGERISYLDAHFRAAHEAMQRGVDLRGYLVWSLLDNFEWALGYSKRFGLIFVDYGTGRRIPKASARWYTKVIENSGPPDGDA